MITFLEYLTEATKKASPFETIEKKLVQSGWKVDMSLYEPDSYLPLYKKDNTVFERRHGEDERSRIELP